VNIASSTGCYTPNVHESRQLVANSLYVNSMGLVVTREVGRDVSRLVD